MQIMFLRNDFWRTLVFMWLALAVAGNVFANTSMSWISNKNGRVSLEATDGSVYELKLFPDVSGVFYDKSKHLIGDEHYVAVFQVSPSSRVRPNGFCGAGTEIWLYVYKAIGAELNVQTRVLVSSCLRSISLVSQNSGEETQDSDFSSVQWNGQGFSIDWFDNVDVAGRALSSTNYVLRDNIFSPMEILNKENLGE
ncbi:hypothetical protein [Pseudomonas sp. PB3P13]